MARLAGAGLFAGLVHVEASHRGAAVEARGFTGAGARATSQTPARDASFRPGRRACGAQIPLRRRRRRTRPHPATPGGRARPARELASRSPCPSPPLLSDLTLGLNEEGRRWKGAGGGRGALLLKCRRVSVVQRSCGKLKRIALSSLEPHES